MDVGFIRLSQLAFGYWNAQTLFTLLELGVFDLVAGGAKSASELSRSCALEPSGGEALLDAGVAVGLLRKQSGLYDNSELSSRFLVGDHPESLANWGRVMGRWATPWTHLREALEHGRPVELQSERLASDARYLEEFIMGMHEYAARTSRDVAAAVDLGQARRLADVGGGAGTYAIALCERHEELEAVVLDLEPVLAICERVVAGAGLQGRIRTSARDYRTSSFGAGFDAILLSNVLHQESRAVGLDMLRRAHDALAPTGRVVVHGHFLEDGRTSPVFATLHNLSARALWQGGRSYTCDEMVALLGEAGFADIEIVAVAKSASTVVHGRSPAGEPPSTEVLAARGIEDDR